MSKRVTDWVGNPDAWIAHVPERSEEGPVLTYVRQESFEFDLPVAIEEMTSFVIASHMLTPRQVVSILDEIASQIEDHG